MNTWIITTGSSDILLRDTKQWNHYRQMCTNIDFKPQISEIHKLDNNNKPYSVPARVLGLVYEQAGDQYFANLFFPLLDSFVKYLNKHNINLNQIVVVLTEQEDLFSESEKRCKTSPYWQDTSNNKTIFRQYFKKKFPNITPTILPLIPKQGGKGLDDWDSVLDLVDIELRNLKLQLSEGDTLYVSHQAGTPAISSAVQFSTLSNFGDKVKFLVSNEYSKDINLINSSKYLIKLQVQRAKKLLTDGFPGAALNLLQGIYQDQVKLDEIEKLINIFNVKDTTDEFDPNSAITRVRQSLDLIEYFFKQENYLQGITLLAAAQETFLKATMVQHLNRNYQNNFREWNEEGIFLKNISGNFKIIADKVDQTTAQARGKNPPNTTWNRIEKPDHLLPWVYELTNTNNGDYWNLLIWSCTHKRDFNSDRRNQLMHNLRGVKKEEVILYITDPEELEQYLQDTQNYRNLRNINLSEPVNEVYQREVKQKFIAALINLCGFDENSYKSLESKINDLSQSL